MYEQETNDININRNFIIPEWKRAKDAILDSYFLTINSMSDVLPKYYVRNVLPNSKLDDWRKGIVSLYFQIREHEKELQNIKNVEEEISNIPKLIEFTDLVLNTKTLKDVKAITRKKDTDPIVEYKKGAYN